MSERPRSKLMDCRMIQDELGVKKSLAEWIMRQIPEHHRFGRRVYVTRAEVDRVVDESKVQAA